MMIMMVAMIIMMIIVVILMIIMTKISKKRGQKIRAWVDLPPSFGQCPKENVFFSLMSSLNPMTLELEH